MTRAKMATDHPKSKPRLQRRREYLEKLKKRKLEAIKGPNDIKTATLNVGTFEEKAQQRQIRMDLEHQGVKIAMLQETRIQEETEFSIANFTFITAGAHTKPKNEQKNENTNTHKRGGAGIRIHKTIRAACEVSLNIDPIYKDITTVILTPKSPENKTIRCISLYTPQESAKTAASRSRWAALRRACKTKEQEIIIGSDTNGVIGEDDQNAWEQIGPRTNEQGISKNGRALLSCLPDECRVANTFKIFPKNTSTAISTTGNGREVDHICTTLRFGAVKVHEPHTMSKETLTHKLVTAWITIKEKTTNKNTQNNKPPRYNKQNIQKQYNIESTCDRKIAKLKERLEKHSQTQEGTWRERYERRKNSPPNPEETQILEEITKDESKKESTTEELQSYRASLELIKEQHATNIKDFEEAVVQSAATHFPDRRAPAIRWRGFAESEATISKRTTRKKCEELYEETLKETQLPRLRLAFQTWAKNPQGIKSAKKTWRKAVQITHRQLQTVKASRRALDESLQKDEMAYFDKKAGILDKGKTTTRMARTWDFARCLRARPGKNTETKLRRAQKTPLERDDGTEAITDEAKMELFDELVKQTFTETNPGYQNNNGLWEISTEIPRQFLPDKPDGKHITKELHDQLLTAITEEEVKTAIHEAKAGKANGPENIATEIFKASPNFWATTFLEWWADDEIFPQVQRGKMLWRWKNKGGRRKVKFYRPITLLNTSYRIWCIAMNNRLKPVIRQTSETTQTGFKQKHSCPTATETTCNIIDRANEPTLSIGCLDQSQAFDRMMREKTWEILLSLGLPKAFVTQLRRGHEDTAVHNAIGTAIGTPIEIDRGAFQGSSLSPTLFILYTRDLNQVFKTHCEERGHKIININHSVPRKGWENHSEPIVNKHSKSILLVSYADDATIFAKSLDELAEMCLLYGQLAQLYNLKVNQGKTQIITRGDPTREEKEEALIKMGVDINNDPEAVKKMISKNTRLLGQYINIDGYKIPAITHRLNIARKIYMTLRKPFFRVKTLRTEYKNLIFYTVIYSTLFYGLETHTLSNHEQNLLQKWINGRIRDYVDLEDTLKKAKIWTNGEEQGENNEKEYIKTAEIARRAGLPNTKTWQEYKRLNHIIAQLRNNTLAAQVMCHEIEGEANPTKKDCGNQAKRPETDDNLLKHYHDSTKQLYEDIKKVAQQMAETATGEENEEDRETKLGETLYNMGYMDIPKILYGIKKGNHRSLERAAELTIKELATAPPEATKNITRTMLRWETIARDERERTYGCLGRGKKFVSETARGSHFAKCTQHKRLDCLKPYKEIWDREDYEELEECPWGKTHCAFPMKKRFCPLCRHCSSKTEPFREKRLQCSKKTNALRKDILHNTNQGYVPHENQKTPDKCPHKRKTCEWPNREGFWCVPCVKSTNFKPQKNKTKEARLAKLSADRQRAAENTDSDS